MSNEISDLREMVRSGLQKLVSEVPNQHAGLELVEFTNLLAEEAALLRDEAVSAARHQKISWAAIGDRLGMTRQAAQQRFGHPAPADPSTTADPANAPVGSVWRLSPITAFDELDLLAQYGAQGWHSVGFGPFYHDMVKDSRPWEHRRVPVFGGPSRAKLEAEGWTLIGDLWFPWSYYARPVSETS
jgi:hypothetical protein